jgi:hypothetical protein
MHRSTGEKRESTGANVDDHPTVRPWGYGASAVAARDTRELRLAPARRLLRRTGRSDILPRTAEQARRRGVARHAPSASVLSPMPRSKAMPRGGPEARQAGHGPRERTAQAPVERKWRGLPETTQTALTTSYEAQGIWGGTTESERHAARDFRPRMRSRCSNARRTDASNSESARTSAGRTRGERGNAASGIAATSLASTRSSRRWVGRANQVP